MGLNLAKPNKSKWKELFRDFISNLSIDSKELGNVKLEEVLYDAQWRFLETVADGLENDVHFFVCLKARQLGISTISLAIDLFWLLVHPGLQGALITDNEPNRDKFRIILNSYINSLPPELRVGVKTHNRNNLVFKNGSVLDYMVAGKRKNNSLGRGRALNFVHATEVSSWGDEEGVASLMASMAEEHPDRLFIFESTALGFNLFWNMWRSAEQSEETQKTIFLGWWSKEKYKVKKNSQVWHKYWDGRITENEQELITKVKQLYDFEVSIEQLVWYRWKEATQMSGENMMAQEFPWTAEQAFVATGKGFFNRRLITKSIQSIYANPIPHKAFRYHMGDDFLATEVEDLEKTVREGGQINIEDMELKIWYPPVSGGYYAMGVDPAYGRSDNKDRHSIQVFRCYADRAVQVAEYCTDNYESKNVAWVMCHLAGLYKNVYINYEINGPGNVVKNELEHLSQLFRVGYLNKRAQEAGMVDFFNYVSWYLYHRADSMGSGFAYGFSTTANSKFMIMNQYRDAYSSNMLELNSIELLEEMQTLVQNGSEICASGTNKDDRVYSTALALEAWVRSIRPTLISGNKTYELVTEEENKVLEPMQNFIAGIITKTFENKSMERQKEVMQAAWSD